MNTQHEMLLRNRWEAKREAKRATIRKVVSGFFHATLGIAGVLLFAYALYTNGAEHSKAMETETYTTTVTYESGMLVFPNGNQYGYFSETLQNGQTVEVTLNEYGNVVFVKGE